MTNTFAESTANDRDKVYLPHLQEVHTASASYYNNRFLGRGGNGTAFLVTCASGENAGIQMVLKAFHKISDPSRQAAFVREINRLKRLEHHAVVRVFDDGEYTNDGQAYPFVLMEFLPRTVRELLTTRQIDRLQAIRIVLNCLSALRYIHSRSPRIVHRDIKPENILLSASGAKLADFGLAKELEELIPRTAETATPDTLMVMSQYEGQEERDDSEFNESQFPGVPRWYRTPELVARIQNRRIRLTPASDIYQLGTVFYELLKTFNPQLPAKSITDPIRLDLRTMPGEQGSELLQFIRQMLNEDPAQRPDASQCLETLDGIHRRFCASLKHVSGDYC